MSPALIILDKIHYTTGAHELKVISFLFDPKELNTDFTDLHRFTRINYTECGKEMHFSAPLEVAPSGKP